MNNKKDKGSAPGLPKISVKDLIEIKVTKEEKGGEVLSSQKTNKKGDGSAPGLPKISVKDLIEIKAMKEKGRGVLSSEKDGDVLSSEKDSSKASLIVKQKKPIVSFVDECVAYDSKNIKGKRINDTSLPGTDLNFTKRVPAPPTRPSLWDLKKKNLSEKEHIEEQKHNEGERWFDRYEKVLPPGQGVLQLFREVKDDDSSKLRASLDICKSHFKSGTVVSCTARYDAEFVWDYLTKKGIYAARWHAGMPKLQQYRAEQDFKKGSFDVYVVTADLLRRVDPPPKFILLNYDLPIYFEDYKKLLLKFRKVCNLINKKSGGMCLIRLVDSGIEVPEFVKEIYEETTKDRKK